MVFDLSPAARAADTVPNNPRLLCRDFVERPAPSAFWCGTCHWNRPLHDDEAFRAAVAAELGRLANADPDRRRQRGAVMGDPTPADELRAAVATLRKLASKATPGIWWAEELPPNEHHAHPAHWVKTEHEDGDNCVSSVVVADCPWRQADAELIAAMHPGVGAALADWLEAEAARTERMHEAYGATIYRSKEALAVARQINRRPSTSGVCHACKHGAHAPGACQGGSVSTITGCRCNGRPS